MNEIDAYILKLPSNKDRGALEQIRSLIRTILPDSVECISYGMPAFRIKGKVVAGFAAFKNHLTFFPFSGSTLDGMQDELSGFTFTKSGVHFTPEKPIPEGLLKKIIHKRLSEL